MLKISALLTTDPAEREARDPSFHAGIMNLKPLLLLGLFFWSIPTGQVQAQDQDTIEIAAATISYLSQHYEELFANHSVKADLRQLGSEQLQTATARRIGIQRAGLNQVRKCTIPDPSGPPSCELRGTDFLVVVDSLGVRGDGAWMVARVYGEASRRRTWWTGWKVTMKREGGIWAVSGATLLYQAG